MNVSCIVLAGGKSTRLGRNKLAEVIGGATLMQRVVETLSRLNSEIIIVAPQHSGLPEIEAFPRSRLINDTHPGKGALGAIYAGLVASKSHYNIVVAADMPFLNINLLQYMIDVAEGADIVAYRDGDRFEPLHAVYSRNCIVPLEKLLGSENTRIIEIVRYAKTRYLTAEEIGRFDPQHLSFFNINSEKELQQALQIAESKRRQELKI